MISAQATNAKPGLKSSVIEPEELSSTFWIGVFIFVFSATIVAIFTMNNYFFQDDFIFLSQAKGASLNWKYLSLALFEHFSPIYRLVDYYYIRAFGTNFFYYRVSLVIMGALGSISLFWAVKPLVIDKRKLFFIAILFSQQIAIIHVVTWWTAGLNLIPALVFCNLSIGAYIRFELTKRGYYLLLSFVYFVIALLSYEMAWLTLGFLGLLAAVVFPKRLTPGEIVKHFAKSTIYWLFMVGAEGASLFNFFKNYYISQDQHPNIREITKFVAVLFYENFAPGVTGLRLFVPTYYKLNLFQVSSHLATDVDFVLSSLLIVAIIAYFAFRSLRLFLIWLSFIIYFLANALIVGIGRVATEGLGAALNPDYTPFAAYVFFLGIALSIFFKDSAKATRATNRRQIQPKQLSVAPGLHKPRVAAVLVAASFEVFFCFSAAYQQRYDLNFIDAKLSRQYVANSLNSITALKLGAQPYTILPGTVPDHVLASNFSPFNDISTFFMLFNQNINTHNFTFNSYALNGTGTAVREVFIPILYISRYTYGTWRKLSALRTSSFYGCLAPGSYQLANAENLLPNLFYLIFYSGAPFSPNSFSVSGWTQDNVNLFTEFPHLSSTTYPYVGQVENQGESRLQFSFGYANSSQCIQAIMVGHFTKE